MLSVTLENKANSTFVKSFEEAFKFNDLTIPADKIADYIATVLISRVRKNFLKQQNPDGSQWPESKSAKKRKAGGYTWAKGGKFAPGGWKTSTGTLFSSGNLFHSIQLVKKGLGEYSIQTDVEYAGLYQNDKITIIGATEAEFNEVTLAVIGRFI